MATGALAAAFLAASTKATGGIQQGSVPDRPDMTYRWAQDETSATFSVQSGGQTQSFRAQQNSAGDFVDAQGNVVATVDTGADGQRSLVVDPDAVDAAIAASSGSVSGSNSGAGSAGEPQVLYYNPETGDVTYAPSGAPPPGYEPVSGAQSDQVGKPSGGTETGTPSNRATSLVDPNLIARLVASGVRIAPENVVATGTAPGGQTVWMETGNAKAGLVHILDHTRDFAGIGVSQSDILNVVMGAIATGDIIGVQGKGGNPRDIYRTVVSGQAYGIAIQIGDNGFIVSANPTGKVP
jgi:hypothetical protein